MIEDGYKEVVDPTEGASITPIIGHVETLPEGVHTEALPVVEQTQDDVYEELEAGIDAVQLTPEEAAAEEAAAAQAAAEAAAEEQAYLDSIPALDLEKGMDNIRQVDMRQCFLYLVNKVVFHPRGYMLAITDDGTQLIMGDGSRPVVYGPDLDEEQMLNRIKVWLP